MTNYNTILQDLKTLGVKNGDVLLVHSSIKSLSHEKVEASDIIEALLSAVGDSGTLLLPALSYDNVSEKQPYFSVNDTPVCVGALPEFFRKYKGVIRSCHPSHSCSAAGAKADEITKRHILDTTPVGEHSPFHLLPQYGGKILFLGCGLHPNTSMHGVEELVVPPYLYKKELVRYILKDAEGKEHEVMHKRHNFEKTVQRYDRAAELLENNELIQGKVMNADCYMMDSEALWKKAHAKLKDNPLYFIDMVD